MNLIESPGVYPFRLGRHIGWGLSDGFFLADPVYQFALGATAHEVDALLQENRLPAGKLVLNLNLLLLRWGDDLILVDPGVGAGLSELAGRLPSRLASIGISPKDVTAVAISHAHIDHLRGAIDPATGSLLFPNARILMAKEEFDFWRQESPDLSNSFMSPAKREETVLTAKALIAAVFSKIELFMDGEELFQGITATALRGHTPGHVGFLLESHGDRLWHIGDALVDPLLHVRHPEWIVFGDSHPRANRETRRTLLKRAAREQLKIHAVHFPFPGFGHVREVVDGSYDFLPERWDWNADETIVPVSIPGASG